MENYESMEMELKNKFLKHLQKNKEDNKNKEAINKTIDINKPNKNELKYKKELEREKTKNKEKQHTINELKKDLTKAKNEINKLKNQQHEDTQSSRSNSSKIIELENDINKLQTTVSNYADEMGYHERINKSIEKKLVNSVHKNVTNMNLYMINKKLITENNQLRSELANQAILKEVEKVSDIRLNINHIFNDIDEVYEKCFQIDQEINTKAKPKETKTVNNNFREAAGNAQVYGHIEERGTSKVLVDLEGHVKTLAKDRNKDYLNAEIGIPVFGEEIKPGVVKLRNVYNEYSIKENNTSKKAKVQKTSKSKPLKNNQHNKKILFICSKFSGIIKNKLVDYGYLIDTYDSQEHTIERLKDIQGKYDIIIIDKHTAKSHVYQAISIEDSRVEVMTNISVKRIAQRIHYKIMQGRE